MVDLFSLINQPILNLVEKQWTDQISLAIKMSKIFPGNDQYLL